MKGNNTLNTLFDFNFFFCGICCDCITNKGSIVHVRELYIEN